MSDWVIRPLGRGQRATRGTNRVSSFPARLAAGFAIAMLPFSVGLIIAYAGIGHSRDLRAAVLCCLACGLLLCALVARRLAMFALRPIRDAVTVLQGAAGGDLRPRLVGTARADEFGDMARALNRMLDNAAEAFFAIGLGVQALSTTSTQLAGTAGQLAVSADNASTESTEVSYAADEVSANVGTVAAGSMQMEGAIRDIADNAARASNIAAEAVGTARHANDTVSQLGESSAQIGKVVDVINTLARQTNLLALNATIEAARAGDAGRGFAVVAGEVKALAQATSKATEDIAKMIANIQFDSGQAVAMIHDIGGVVERINDFQATIAGAVEEQTASSNEMTRSIAEAAHASGRIASTIVGVAAAALSTASSVTDTMQASVDVNRTADDIGGIIGGFRY